MRTSHRGLWRTTGGTCGSLSTGRRTSTANWWARPRKTTAAGSAQVSLLSLKHATNEEWWGRKQSERKSCKKHRSSAVTTHSETTHTFYNSYLHPRHAAVILIQWRFQLSKGRKFFLNPFEISELHWTQRCWPEATIVQQRGDEGSWHCEMEAGVHKQLEMIDIDWLISDAALSWQEEANEQQHIILMFSIIRSVLDEVVGKFSCICNIKQKLISLSNLQSILESN